MTKKATALLAVLFMCTLPGARAQDEPAESRLKIAFIAKSYANPVFVAAHRGAQDAAKEYSSVKGVPVEVLVLTPTGENPEQQAERIGSAVVTAVLIHGPSRSPSLAHVIAGTQGERVLVPSRSEQEGGARLRPRGERTS